MDFAVDSSVPAGVATRPVEHQEPSLRGLQRERRPAVTRSPAHVVGSGHQAARLPEYNPHGLRHKGATVTLSSGLSVHEVSRRLGHRSIKATVDKYGHLTQDGQERRRQVIEAAVAPHMLTTGPGTSEPGADSVPGRRASRCSRHRPYRF
ncbi:tyrosine-type recombinase/integrase [Streptomyces sp. NPDC059153]|uniref:tyrosine-type recombinase/integrase n=1 Tax=unclassified Streptomyces TaxID=2593676 RepID=UPI0036B425DD